MSDETENEAPPSPDRLTRLRNAARENVVLRQFPSLARGLELTTPELMRLLARSMLPRAERQQREQRHKRATAGLMIVKVALRSLPRDRQGDAFTTFLAALVGEYRAADVPLPEWLQHGVTSNAEETVLEKETD